MCAKKRPPPPCPLIFNVEKTPGRPMQLLSTLKFRGSRGGAKFGTLNHTRSLLHHTCFWCFFFFAHTGTPRFPLHPSSCAMHSLPQSTMFLCCRYCSHASLRKMARGAKQAATSSRQPAGAKRAATSSAACRVSAWGEELGDGNSQLGRSVLKWLSRKTMRKRP